MSTSPYRYGQLLYAEGDDRIYSQATPESELELVDLTPKPVLTGQALLDSIDQTLARASLTTGLLKAGFSDRPCKVCGQTFSATGDRRYCNAHAHLAGR